MTNKQRMIALTLLAEIEKDPATKNEAKTYGSWWVHLTDHIEDSWDADDN